MGEGGRGRARERQVLSLTKHCLRLPTAALALLLLVLLQTSQVGGE